jgi:flagellar biosynthesis protein FlhB
MAEAADKTEAPTQRRREEARREGKIARSNDLVAAATLLASLILLQVTAPRLIAACRAIVRDSLASPDSQVAISIAPIGRAVLPVLVGLIAAALAINLAQTGFLLRWKLNFEVFEPSAGFAKVFSKRSATTLVMNAVKFLAAAWIAWEAGNKVIDQIVGLQHLAPADGLSAGAAIVFGVGVRISIVLLLLAAIDYAIERWRFEQELRMTRREVKDELRQMEGDPAIRQRRREFASSIARKVS